MILESGEEIFCGYASSIFTFFLGQGKTYVPMSGNKEYVLIKNIYNPDRHQIVSYKSI